MRTVVELIFFFRNLSIWWRKLAIFSPTCFLTLIQKMTKKKWTNWKLHHSFSKSEWSWTWLNLKHLLIRFFRLHQIEIVKHFGCKVDEIWYSFGAFLIEIKASTSVSFHPNLCYSTTWTANIEFVSQYMYLREPKFMHVMVTKYRLYRLKKLYLVY